MVKFPYKNFLTSDEFLKLSGYNLATRLNAGDDTTNGNDIANRFLLEASRQIFELISSYSNRRIATLLFDSDEIEVIDNLTLAQYYQAVYLFENGDLEADSTSESNKIYSKSAIKVLSPYLNGVLM